MLGEIIVPSSIPSFVMGTTLSKKSIRAAAFAKDIETFLLNDLRDFSLTEKFEAYCLVEYLVSKASQDSSEHFKEIYELHAAILKSDFLPEEQFEQLKEDYGLSTVFHIIWFGAKRALP